MGRYNKFYKDGYFLIEFEKYEYVEYKGEKYKVEEEPPILYCQIKDGSKIIKVLKVHNPEKGEDEFILKEGLKIDSFTNTTPEESLENKTINKIDPDPLIPKKQNVYAVITTEEKICPNCEIIKKMYIHPRKIARVVKMNAEKFYDNYLKAQKN